MKNNNLHISMNHFTHASRVMKEIKTILKHTNTDSVFIAAIHKENILEEEDLLTNVSLKRFKLNSKKLPKTLIFQLIKYIEFSMKICSFYKNKNIKMINVHSLALLPLGVLLKIVFKAVLIYDTHELETETRNLSGIRKFLSKGLESVLFRFCDGVICVNKSISQWYQERYKMEAPPAIVINTPVFKKINKKKNLFREEFGIDEQTKIYLYQGGLTIGRNIETLLTTFSEYNDAKSKRAIVFMGYGILEDKVKAYAKKNSNIFFKPAVSQNDLMDYTSSADVGFVLIDKGALSYEFSLPNKLFEYAMAGLAIIASDNIEIKNFVEHYNCGFCLSEISPDTINKLLNEFEKKTVHIFSQNALKMFEENNWSHQEEILKEFYSEIITIK